MFHLCYMKGLIYFLIIVTVVSSCGNNKADEPAAEEDTAIAPTHFIWQSTLNDSTGKLELVPLQPLASDSLQPEAVITGINKINEETGYYSKVELVFLKTSTDTIYLKIPEANYLTQQMGSTGPRLFFAGVVYTLTGIPGINYVNFDFEEGDHAGPGTYSRLSFKDD